MRNWTWNSRFRTAHLTYGKSLSLEKNSLLLHGGLTMTFIVHKSPCTKSHQFWLSIIESGIQSIRTHISEFESILTFQDFGAHRFNMPVTSVYTALFRYKRGESNMAPQIRIWNLYFWGSIYSRNCVQKYKHFISIQTRPSL